MPNLAVFLALLLAAASNVLCSLLPRKEPRNYILDGGFEAITTQRPRGQKPWTAGNWTFIKYADPLVRTDGCTYPGTDLCAYEGQNNAWFIAYVGPVKGAISQQVRDLRDGPFNMSFAYGIMSHPLTVNCTWITTLESQILDNWVITTDSPSHVNWTLRNFQINPLVGSGALNISWSCPQFREDPDNDDYGAQFVIDDISIVKST